MRCLVIRNNSILLIACLLVFSGCGSGLNYIVQLDNPHGLQVGDRLFMNDIPIGIVKELSLETSDTVKCVINLKTEYKEFLNKSTVFSWADDPEIADRKSLICKNCDKLAPKVPPGYEFKGLGMLSYTLACLGQQVDTIWLSFMRDTLESAIADGENFSRESIEKIEAFARSNSSAFEDVLHDLNDLVDELNVDARTTLEEIRIRNRDR